MVKYAQTGVRNISFWYYQIIGWSIFYIIDLIVFMIILRKQTFMGIIAETMGDLSFFTVSICLRNIYRRIDHKKASASILITNVIAWSAVTAIIWESVLLISMSIFEVPAEAVYNYQAHSILANTLFIYMPISLCWSALYFGIKFWIDYNKEKDRADEALLLAQRAKLMMLRSQLNPHFLFNALNSIRALIEEDARTAKLIITELFEFLQYSFTSEHKTIITLKDELTSIRYYLSIEKKRYEDKLDILWDIDPQAENFRILNFLIHPLVENAIKHGMQTSSMPLKMRIGAHLINGSLQISVDNSGRWLARDKNQNSNGTGTGIENVRARLENAFPGRFSLEMSEKDDWVYVILRINENIADQAKNPELRPVPY